MADLGYTLSESDVRILRDLLARDRDRVVNTANLPNPQHFPPSSEVLVLRAPADGIAAAYGVFEPGEMSASGELMGTGSGTHQTWRPGWATADIYRITLQDEDNVPELEPIWLDQVAYNLSAVPVPPYSWVLAIQDRFGDWVVEAIPGAYVPDFPGTGTGTGTGHFSYLEYRTDCIGGINVRYSRLIWVDDSARRSFTGPWAFDSNQGDCGAETGTGTGTGTDGDRFIYHEYKTECEQGRNVRYKRLIQILDPISDSRVGPWMFDEYEGSCDFPGTGTGTILECTAVTSTEEKVECEDGLLNVYQRTYTWNIVNGCLTKSLSAYAYNRSEGYCGKDGVVYINIVNIYDFTSYVSNTIYFNQYNQTLNVNINNYWYTYCICYPDWPGTGSSSIIGGCKPGVCAICTDPPWRITVPATTFTGDATVFNADWVLEYLSPCTWKQTKIVGGLPVEATLLLAAGGHTLNFSTFSAEGTPLSASYTSPATALPNCCNNLTFTNTSCIGDYPDETGTSAQEQCAQCVNTPSMVRMTAAGFTGCYSRFNGTFLLPYMPGYEDVFGPGACVWKLWGGDDDFQMAWAVLPTGTGELRMLDSSGRLPAYAKYTSPGAVDCCDDEVVNRVQYFCNGTGDAPATLIVEPLCEGEAVGTCPASLIANPVCCLDGGTGTDRPPDDPSCGCACCPDGAPLRWRFFIDHAEFIYAGAEGQWMLAYVEDTCIWRQTRNGITFTLECHLAVSGGQTRWILTAEDGDGNSHVYRLAGGGFRCCGINDFMLFETNNPAGTDPNESHLDKNITLLPDGACSPCDDDGTGTSDGTGTNSGGGSVSCCPGVTVANQLFVTFEGLLGCACADGMTTTVERQEGLPGGSQPEVWDGEITLCGASAANGLELGCDFGGWYLTTTSPAGACLELTGVLRPFSMSCTPFEIVFNVSADCSGAGGSAGGSITLTFTD